MRGSAADRRADDNNDDCLPAISTAITISTKRLFGLVCGFEIVETNKKI